MKAVYTALLLSLTALVAGGAWWWQKTGAISARVAQALPPPPDFSAALPVLRERIAAAEARARSRISAKRGLEELGLLYHANGYLEEAMDCYSGLEQLEPANARWPHLHATILAGYGEIEPATRLWQTAVRLDPDYVPSKLRLADCLLKSNHFGESASTYADVLKSNPDNAYALLGLARIDFESHHWEDARARLEKLVAQTNYNLGYDLIVSVYEHLGDSAKAREVRERNKASGAYRDPPDPWVDGLIDSCFDPYRISLVAGAEAGAGNTDRAVRLLERAINLAPNDVSSHYQLGCLSESRHEFNTAREQLQICTILEPDFADGWTHLSLVLAAAGDQSGAENALNTGLQKCPDSPGLHLERARNLRQEGRTDEAISEYLTSIRLRPNEPDAYTELGSIYIAMGRTDEGIQEMQGALDADPGDPVALGILAYHAITTGDEATADPFVERVENQPRIPGAQMERLLEAYKQRFGHDWKPPAKSRQ